MNEILNLDRILELRLSGKFAHFRKFYTNASSLSYLIPPRTVICGLLASIMKFPRDEYYGLFSSNKLAVAISIPLGSSYTKLFQTMNYAQDKSSSTPINDLSAHKQCRLELLKSAGENELGWIVYVGYCSDNHTNFASLENKILAHDFGYGLYLGQRQFTAHLELIKTYSKDEFSHCEYSDYLDSAICKDQIRDIQTENYHLSLERMPLDQKVEISKNKTHRQTIRFGDVVVEVTGKRLAGEFQSSIELHNSVHSRISFL